MVNDNSTHLVPGQRGCHAGVMAREGMAGGVALEEVGAHNWAACADLHVADDQAQFVAPITRYLAMCAYGDNPWHPLAVVEGDTVIGFVMHAIDTDDNSLWIGGLLIDTAHQRRGHGRAATRLLIAQAFAGGHRNAALSYAPSNQPARSLYASLGFVETGELVDDELVARRPLVQSSPSASA